MPAPSDLVHQTSTSTGTGNLTLAAVNGKRSFLTAFGTGGTNTFDYFVASRDAAEWERGTGHETGGALVRDTVTASSNANAPVNFSAGTKDVTNDIPAANQARLDAANSWPAPQSFAAAINLAAGQIVFPASQNASANANTLDDYEEGTWTPSFGGFSAAPTGGVGRYIKVGRIVVCNLNSFSSGTSNATTKTVTLPFASLSADVMAGMGHPMDNGVFSNNPCRIDTRTSSTIADVYKNLNVDPWTSSGSCVFDFTFTYAAAA